MLTDFGIHHRLERFGADMNFFCFQIIDIHFKLQKITFTMAFLTRLNSILYGLVCLPFKRGVMILAVLAVQVNMLAVVYGRQC